MANLVTIEGAFGKLELLDNNTKLKKTYLEDRKKLHTPRLVVASDKVYKVWHTTEHEAHELLTNSSINNIPKIYSYEETKYLDIQESKRPTIPEILVHQHAKPEDLYYCSVVMDYLPYPSMFEVYDTVLYNKRENAVQLVKLWFKNILNMIQHAHIIPADFHTGNMLCDLPKNVYFIDYAYYEHLSLVCKVDDSNMDYGFKLNTKTGELSKTNLSTMETTPISEITDFKISQYDAEMLLIPNLIKDMNRNLYKCVQQVVYAMFQNDVINIYTQAMKELNISPKLQDIVISLIIRPVMTRDIRNSLLNWMNAAGVQNSPSHVVLTYYKIHPIEFANLQNYWDPKLEADGIYKMTGDEVMQYIDSHKSEISKVIKHYILLKWHKFGAKKEYVNLFTYVIHNLETKSELYRVEFTDRFNKLKPGDMVKWENLITSTPKKEFAAMFLDNTAGSCVEQPNSNAQNYMFKFSNIKAACIKTLESDKTVYILNCNSKNPDDTNWLNFDTPNRVMIGGGEYMIEPNQTFKVKSINPGQSISHTTYGKTYSHTYTLIELELKH